MRPFFITLFVCLFLTISMNAQNILFSFEKEIISSSQTDVKIYAETSSGTENLTGYTIYFYYDNTETTVDSYDSSPTTTGLGWTTANQSNIDFQAHSNSNVTITHTGYFFYQNFDNAFTGDDMSTTPTHLLTISFDHSTGTTDSGFGWLAETDEVPGLVYIDNLFTGYDVVTTGIQSQVLPVELSDFRANPKQDQIQLKWEVTNEQNFSHYDIQRSLDGQQFQSIGIVNGNQQQYYEFSDRDIVSNTSYYYRLQNVDMDGSFNYSSVVMAQIQELHNSLVSQIYPNPVTTSGQINIWPTDDVDMIKIIDDHGVVVKRLRPNRETSNIQINGFTTGVYTIQVMKRREIEVLRMVVVEE